MPGGPLTERTDKREQEIAEKTLFSTGALVDDDFEIKESQNYNYKITAPL